MKYGENGPGRKVSNVNTAIELVFKTCMSTGKISLNTPYKFHPSFVSDLKAARESNKEVKKLIKKIDSAWIYPKIGKPVLIESAGKKFRKLYNAAIKATQTT